MVRDAGRAGVEIEAVGELAELVGPAGLHDPVAAAHGPDPPADPLARLEHGHVPAGAAELIGGDQAGDAGAEDRHLAAAAAATGQVERLGRGRRHVQQPHRLHAEIDGAGAADRSEPLEETPAGEAHWLAPRCATAGVAAVTSISTSQPGSTSPATAMVERAGRMGCASVPKNSR